MTRVLVADDASFMRQMIRDIIDQEGFEVVGQATDGVEAVDALKSLQLATRIVTLQPLATDALPSSLRTKARVIYQSTTPPDRPETRARRRTRSGCRPGNRSRGAGRADHGRHCRGRGDRC